MYYKKILSLDELVGDEGILRLPPYIFEEFVEDDERREIIYRAVDALKSGGRVILYGPAGTGKTALMAIILREMINEGYQIGQIIDGTIVSRSHEEEGIVLFYDDIPRMSRNTLKSIIDTNARMIISTARIEEMDTLSRKLGGDPTQYFDMMEINPMSEIYLREILTRYAIREGIRVNVDAVDIVVMKAQGLPVYIWQVIRDLKINKRLVLDEGFASRIPEGMLDYVDDILWRIMGDSEERKEILLTLLILADLPEYKAHQDLFNAIFAESKKAIYGREFTIKEILLSDMLDKICRYLARTYDYSFKLPHDAWRDVLIGKSRGLMSGEISRINSAFPKQERMKILKNAIERTYKEIITKIEDVDRKEAFISQVGKIHPELKVEKKVEKVEEKPVAKEITIVEEKEELPEVLTGNKNNIAKKKKMLGLVISEFVIMNEKRVMIINAEVGGGLVGKDISLLDSFGRSVGWIDIKILGLTAKVYDWDSQYIGAIKKKMTTGEYIIEDSYGVKRYTGKKKNDVWFIYDMYDMPVARIITGKKEDRLEIIGEIHKLLALSIVLTINILK